MQVCEMYDLSHFVTNPEGVCDDDLGLCYCDGPLGRIPAPDDAPPGTPPRRRGRPLMNQFEQPTTVGWGGAAWVGYEGRLRTGRRGMGPVLRGGWSAWVGRGVPGIHNWGLVQRCA